MGNRIQAFQFTVEVPTAPQEPTWFSSDVGTRPTELLLKSPEQRRKEPVSILFDQKAILFPAYAQAGGSFRLCARGEAQVYAGVQVSFVGQLEEQNSSASCFVIKPKRNGAEGSARFSSPFGDFLVEYVLSEVELEPASAEDFEAGEAIYVFLKRVKLNRFFSKGYIAEEDFALTGLDLEPTALTRIQRDKSFQAESPKGMTSIETRGVFTVWKKDREALGLLPHLYVESPQRLRRLRLKPKGKAMLTRAEWQESLENAEALGELSLKRRFKQNFPEMEAEVSLSYQSYRLVK